MKEKLKHIAPWLLLLVLLAGLAAVHGLQKSFVNNYEIMDGDWQNYNPVRRMLAGQRPFEDFTVYLGAGELYSVGAVLLAVGNSFGRSMFASNFLTWFYFEILILAVCTAVFRRGRSMRAATLALCGGCFALVHAALPFTDWYTALLSYAAANGNSARMIRSAGLPLAVLAAAFGLKLLRRHPKVPDARGRKRLFPLEWEILVPLAAGALIPWSNDMGAALYLSVSLAYGLLLVRRYGSKMCSLLRETARYIGISFLGFGGAVLLISWGHPLAWLRQTRGAGSDQAWYYGSLAEGKLLHLTDMELDAAFWAVLALAAVFAVAVLRAKKQETALSAAGCFVLCLGMTLWNVLYCVLSASTAGPAGGADALAAVMIPALLLRGLSLAAPALPRLRRAVPPLAAGAAAFVLCVGLAGQITQRMAGRGEEYVRVDSLGAWLSDQAPKLETEQQIAAGTRVWGTYAGALETMTGQFQPSGTDYIIHVLGDAQRAAYLQKFEQGDFELVETPSWKVSAYERWSRNANWWFYRELYRSWQPVGTTFACGGMHLFWQRTGVDNALGETVQVQTLQQTPDSVTVTVTAAHADFCGVADVALTYAAKARFLRVESVTEKALCEAAGRESWTCDYFIPTEKTQTAIPVTISNGTGTITLTALAAGEASVAVQSAQADATYTDWEYFYE